MASKQANMSCPESELLFDLLIRTEKIFKHIRRQVGSQVSIEQFNKWQKTQEQLTIHYAEMLENISIDIDKPELYNDSNLIVFVKNKRIKESKSGNPSTPS